MGGAGAAQYHRPDAITFVTQITRRRPVAGPGY